LARIEAPKLQEMSSEQRRVYDIIASGPRNGVRGPLAIWLHRPVMAQHAQGLGQFCRYDTSLPSRLSELAILILACIWRSEYEWWAHKPLALAAGVSHSVVDALMINETPVFEHDDEAVVFDFLTNLHTTRKVPSDIYDRAEALLGKNGVIDLVAVAGYYTLISMSLNVFEIGVPDGAPRELERS